MTRVWLIRHGEPAETARQRCYGSLDVGLSEAGRAQMRRVAEYLRGEQFSAVYASPRSRAMESAQILTAERCPVEITPALREIDFGEFEGLTYDEIARRYPELYRRWMERPTEVQFPGGESFHAAQERVLAAFHAILREREGQTFAVVSHGGVNRILLGWALQMPDHCLFRLAQDHAAINLLAFLEGVPIVQAMNCRATSCGG